MPGLRRDVELAEHQPPHRVDGVGERIERFRIVNHSGSPAAGNSAPEMKYIGMMIICITPMNDCIVLIRIATLRPNAVITNASNS